MRPEIIVIAAAVLMFLLFEPLYLHFSYNPTKRRIGNGCPVALTFKGLATMMAVVLAILGYLETRDGVSLLMLIAIILCMVSDVLIGVNFIVGMASFLVAHLFFIPAFLQLGEFRWWLSLVIFLVGMFVVFMLFRKHFEKAGKLLVPCLIYSVVLNAMFSVGICIALAGDIRSIILSAGAFCFLLSDLTLARNMFVRKTLVSDSVSLTIYYSAQFLLGLFVYYPLLVK